MNDADHDWSLYRSFLAVVNTGSLSAAARTLRTTQPTIGRHIAALEKFLGGRALFTRSQQGLRPTEVGRDLLPHAQAMASAADALVRAASAQADEVAGAVRITASDVVGAEILPPMLTEFRRKHPRVEIELGLSNENVDLLRRDADIAVRMVKPTQKALIARKAGVALLVFYATRDYLDRYGTPRSLDDMPDHTFIGFDKLLPPQRFLDIAPFKVSRELFAFRCDNDLGQLAALRAGFGIGAIQTAIAQRDPTLIPVLTDHIRFELEFWVTMHENLKKVQRMRLMFDHLVAQLAKISQQAPQL
jgi:DNA-binding transcriptional LysR family regulator